MQLSEFAWRSFFLHRQDVGKLAIVARSPALAVVLRIDKLLVDADVVGPLHNASDQDCSHPKLARDCLRIYGLPFVAED